MKKTFFITLSASLILLFSLRSFAQSDTVDTVKPSYSRVDIADTVKPNIEKPVSLSDLKISGFGWMEFGEIMHGYYGPEELDHRWQERFETRLDLSAPVNDRLHIDVGTEIWYQYSTTVAQNNGPSYLPGINMIIDRADLTYNPLKGAFPLTLQAGYFKFKYNQEAMNLGEYMFRSQCYPTIITNNFDFPMNRLLGFNIENSILKNNADFSFTHNLLLTSETEIFPYEDISLSYLFSMNIWKSVFTLGGGISGQRMFSVDENNTTPHDSRTISEIKNIRDGVDKNGIPITVGDTTFYSFAGTKIMVHGTFDPKPLIPFHLFGSEDCKVYGELAVLGLKDYPIYKDSTIRYDLFFERMPIMLGFNVPTFKFLDVLSLEFEYFKNRYYNDYYNQILGKGSRLPIPYSPAVGERTGMDSSYVHYVKWSVYAKKSIGNNVQVIAQVARDHRHAIINLSDPRYGDYGDNLTSDKDWYFMIKLAYGF